MIFRALDTTGDWMFGGGLSSYYNTDLAIIANIDTTLRTFLTECFFNQTIGVPWFDLINERNKSVIVLSIKSEISACYGVINVSNLEYTFTLARELEIKYAIDTIYTKNLLGTVLI